MTTVNAHIVQEPGSTNQETVEVYFDNMPGGAAVARAASVEPVAAPDASPAKGAAPTKAEFDALVAEANECKRQLNALIASLAQAGAAA